MGLDSGQLIHRWLAFSGIPQEYDSSSPGGKITDSLRIINKAGWKFITTHTHTKLLNIL